MQIKTTMRYYLLVEWLLSKRQKIKIIGKDAEKKESLCTVGTAIMESSTEGPQKIKNTTV